ncbi:MAG: class I SAM-dependent methyltransferase [Candidatus Zambryskibacteria bacterium]
MQENIKIWVGEMGPARLASESVAGGDYKLLDSGGGEKLEEIGGKRIIRKEPRAWWNKTVASSWQPVVSNLEEVIDIGIGNIKAKIKYKNTSKHIGIFPEQAPQWQWMSKKLKDLKIERLKDSGKKGEEIKILNLFGYTGIASLVAAQSGAKVTHVDASKQSVDWARENQKLSGLEGAPIRWIVDDVIKFVRKKVKQGKKYDAIIMDPPSYGRGPKGEVWKIEERLPELLEVCRQILSDKPLFVIFNMYSTELSSISVANLLADMTKGLGGNIESGELAIKHWGSERLLPMSIFAIWNTTSSPTLPLAKGKGEK